MAALFRLKVGQRDRSSEIFKSPQELPQPACPPGKHRLSAARIATHQKLGLEDIAIGRKEKGDVLPSVGQKCGGRRFETLEILDPIEVTRASSSAKQS